MGNWTPSSYPARLALADLREEKVFEDKLVVLAPRTIKSIDHLLDASRSGLKVMVQRLGCSYTEKLLHLFGTNGTRPDRIMEIGTLEGIIGLVETGVGVATMPESFVRPLLRGRKVALLALAKGYRNDPNICYFFAQQRVVVAG